MADNIQISSPGIIVNNDVVKIVPNSVVFTEGFGEQQVRPASLGGGSVTNIYSDNIEMKKSMVKFSVYPTNEVMNQLRTWKNNTNANVVQIISGSFTRTIVSAALINNYEANLGADTQIDLEFEGDRAV